MKKDIFYITSGTKRWTRDSYEKGEVSEPEEVELYQVEGFYSTIKDLADAVGIPSDEGSWYAFDDGRIICSVAENHFGSEPSESEMKQFYDGEIDLFAVEYDFSVKFIEGIFTPSMKEIGETFKIETYS